MVCTCISFERSAGYVLVSWPDYHYPLSERFEYSCIEELDNSSCSIILCYLYASSLVIASPNLQARQSDTFSPVFPEPLPPPPTPSLIHQHIVKRFPPPKSRSQSAIHLTIRSMALAPTCNSQRLDVEQSEAAFSLDSIRTTETHTGYEWRNILEPLVLWPAFAYLFTVASCDFITRYFCDNYPFKERGHNEEHAVFEILRSTSGIRSVDITGLIRGQYCRTSS